MRDQRSEVGLSAGANNRLNVGGVGGIASHEVSRRGHDTGEGWCRGGAKSCPLKGGGISDCGLEISDFEVLD